LQERKSTTPQQEEEKKYHIPFRGSKFHRYRECHCCGRMQSTESNYCGMCKEEADAAADLVESVEKFIDKYGEKNIWREKMNEVLVEIRQV
jgi:hypothetical protein